MKDIDKEQPAIKQYLLGHLDEEGRQRYEEQFVSDPEFREAALAVEAEMLDDYLAGLLPSVERERFESYYLSVPRHAQELELTRALREYALQDERLSLRAGADVVPPPARQKAGHRSPYRRWVPAVGVAALLLIALVAFWKFAGGPRRSDPQAAINVEVALLNRQPRGQDVPLKVRLTHVLSRGAQQAVKVSVPGGVNVVELQLDLPGRRHQNYQASLRVNDGAEVFNVGDLQAEEADGGRAIKLRVPARLLTPQDYILSVKGATAAGQPEDVAEYFFRVVR